MPSVAALAPEDLAPRRAKRRHGADDGSLYQRAFNTMPFLARGTSSRPGPPSKAAQRVDDAISPSQAACKREETKYSTPAPDSENKAPSQPQATATFATPEEAAGGDTPADADADAAPAPAAPVGRGAIKWSLDEPCICKKLTNTDISMNRITLPDPNTVEAFLGSEKREFVAIDARGNAHNLRYRFWTNRTSRMYIVSGAQAFITQAGSTTSPVGATFQLAWENEQFVIGLDESTTDDSVASRAASRPKGGVGGGLGGGDGACAPLAGSAVKRARHPPPSLDKAHAATKRARRPGLHTLAKGKTASGAGRSKSKRRDLARKAKGASAGGGRGLAAADASEGSYFFYARDGADAEATDGHVPEDRPGLGAMSAGVPGRLPGQRHAGMGAGPGQGWHAVNAAAAEALRGRAQHPACEPYSSLRWGDAGAELGPGVQDVHAEEPAEHKLGTRPDASAEPGPGVQDVHAEEPAEHKLGTRPSAGRVRVWWALDRRWFSGFVHDAEPCGAQYVCYDNGQHLWHDLLGERWEYLPPPPAPAAPAEPQPRLADAQLARRIRFRVKVRPSAAETQPSPEDVDAAGPWAPAAAPFALGASLSDTTGTTAEGTCDDLTAPAPVDTCATAPASEQPLPPAAAHGPLIAGVPTPRCDGEEGVGAVGGEAWTGKSGRPRPSAQLVDEGAKAVARAQPRGDTQSPLRLHGGRDES
eukprot:CAMPEP_0185164752 /NCGR_PEP_ID=MMETSP1139-20130426/9853_1 /TAXON_ID=298111 /ORGANISM="Pavlova sp., Strain CCMP459" /LENGTH=701 /DNA_ID=CAMNT_0027730135 /DNA_START=124 /DNA_END=2229 /DNA_ORIENTATION=-